MTDGNNAIPVLWLAQNDQLDTAVRELLKDDYAVNGPLPLSYTIGPDEFYRLIIVSLSTFDSAVESFLITYDATVSGGRPPICVISDSLMPDDITRAIELGADEVFSLFDHPTALRARIRAMTRLSERLHSLEGRYHEASRRLAEVSRNKRRSDDLLSQIEEKEKEINQQSRRIEKLLSETRGQLLAATNLQQNLLPQIVPDPSHTRLYDRFIPAGALGGDFYDYILFDDGGFDIIIADTSGHGVSAALVSVQIRAVVRTFIADAQINGRRPGPQDVLKHLNEFMLATFSGQFFMTMYYISYQSDTAALTWSGAGHNPFLFLAAGAVEPVQFFSQNLPLGLVAGPPFKQDTLDWNVGDRVLLYTDGLVEAVDTNGEMFGPERLMTVLKSNGGLTGEALLDSLLLEVEVFSGPGTKFPDDVTIVMMERTG